MIANNRRHNFTSRRDFPENLVLQLVSGEDWVVGNTRPFSGDKSKVQQKCYTTEAQLSLKTREKLLAISTPLREWAFRYYTGDQSLLVGAHCFPLTTRCLGDIGKFTNLPSETQRSR